MGLPSKGLHHKGLPSRYHLSKGPQQKHSISQDLHHYSNNSRASSISQDSIPQLVSTLGHNIHSPPVVLGHIQEVLVPLGAVLDLGHTQVGQDLTMDQVGQAQVFPILQQDQLAPAHIQEQVMGRQDQVHIL